VSGYGMPGWLKHKIAGQAARRHRLQAALERGGLTREAAELRAEQIAAAHLLGGMIRRGGKPQAIGDIFPSASDQASRTRSGRTDTTGPSDR
jgi:hypothetical protein